MQSEKQTRQMLIYKQTNRLIRSADGPRRARTGPGPGPGPGLGPGPGPGPRVLSESADMRTLRKDIRHREAASNAQRDVRHVRGPGLRQG